MPVLFGRMCVSLFMIFSESCEDCGVGSLFFESLRKRGMMFRNGVVMVVSVYVLWSRGNGVRLCLHVI